MNFAFFRTLIVAVRHGSFAKAASVVNLTPSAVGLQIKQLEDYFGKPLFDRSARAVKPTPFAFEVVAKVEHTLKDLEELRVRRDEPASGTIRLGAIETAQTAILPDMLRRLRTIAPDLSVKIVRSNSQLLIQDVKADRIDVAIVVRPVSGGTSRLTWRSVLREPYVLLTLPDTPVADPKKVLENNEWISLNRNATDGYLAAKYVEKLIPGKRSTLELPGIDAIVAIVATGLGVSIVPVLRPQQREAYDVKETELNVDGPIREISLVCRSAEADSKNVRAVARALGIADISSDTPTPASVN